MHMYRDSLSTPREKGSSPQHVWFHVEVHAEPAPPDVVVPISCPALSRVTTHLTITNTHPHSLLLNVSVTETSISITVYVTVYTVQIRCKV